MSIKKYRCKIEEIPMLAECIVSNAEKDISDFHSYSAVFTTGYLATVRAKIEICNELLQSAIINRELKTIEQQFYNKSKDLHIKLNTMQEYLEFGVDSSYIADIDLKKIRVNIYTQNIEKLLLNMNIVLKTVNRNFPELRKFGLKKELIGEITTLVQDISSLNDKQNKLINERNSVVEANIVKFNDLWLSMQPILSAAKVIYRGDEIKMKDYSLTQLKKKLAENIFP
ncbi:MAG: hypothetical protein LBS43_11875 [Prevotellaceae bacterium]|nr:hypothetical protein [Prevotellaceae bacterium]